MELGGEEIMEFTEEQQEYIDNLIAEEKKGLYTKEDLDKEVTSEVDRRVESGIQKGLVTQRTKWEEEYQAKAKLTAEEIAKLELKEQMDGLVKREAEINKRSNMIDAKDALTNAGIPKDDYSKFINLLVSDDSESTTENVKSFIDSFTSTKKNIESTIRKELSNIPAPKGNPDEGQPAKATSFVDIANAANIRNN